eukprot:1692028-Alexandrium_andersonii.AAC.1
MLLKAVQFGFSGCAGRATCAQHKHRRGIHPPEVSGTSVEADSGTAQLNLQATEAVPTFRTSSFEAVGCV